MQVMRMFPVVHAVGLHQTISFLWCQIEIKPHEAPGSQVLPSPAIYGMFPSKQCLSSAAW